MRNALKLATVLLIGVAACAVDDASPHATESTDSSALLTELPIAGPQSATSAGPITQNVTCFSEWDCDLICGFYNNNGILVRYPTNVLHQVCSDGSDTVIRTDPCGEACF